MTRSVLSTWNFMLFSSMILFCSLSQAQVIAIEEPKNAYVKVCDTFNGKTSALPVRGQSYGTGRWKDFCTIVVQSNWAVDHDQQIEVSIIYRNDKVVTALREEMNRVLAPPYFKKANLTVCDGGEYHIADDLQPDDRSGGEGYMHCGKYDVMFEYKGRKALVLLPDVLTTISKLSF